ncbi:MAG: glycosyltransferase family 2 protein, partial [Candidatus Moraniibacteriota bacterium]
LVHAREAGFRASTGELIANIDADTILPPQWIEKAERYFDRDPQVVAVSGPYIYHDLSWLINVGVWFFYLIGYVGHLFHRLLGHSGTLLQGGNFVLRRSALVQVGGYDLDYHFWGEDTAIAMKIGKVGKIVFTYRLPMYTSGRRLQEEGVLTMAGRYALNHVSTIFFRRPLSKEVRHIRK